MQSLKPKSAVPLTILSIGPVTSSHPDWPNLYRVRIQPTDNNTPLPTIEYLAAAHKRQGLSEIHPQA